MDTLQKFDYNAVWSSIKASTPLQAGLVALSAAGVCAAYFLFPYAKIGASVFKGWSLSFIRGTPERRLLAYVQANAKKGDPNDILKTIDEWCWSSQWMMNIGNIKGQILDRAVSEAQPKVRRQKSRKIEIVNSGHFWVFSDLPPPKCINRNLAENYDLKLS